MNGIEDLKLMLESRSTDYGKMRQILSWYLLNHDKIVADLRAKINVAEDALTKLQDRLVSSVYDGTIDPHEALRITENALSAIREEGGSKINAKCVACPVQANCSGCPRGEYCDESNCPKTQGGAM